MKMQSVYTVASDNTISKWNYSAANSLELAYQQNMKDEVLAIDVHPSGFYMLISFNSHLRYCNLMADHIKTYHEDPEIKGAKEIKFSNGGHLFAVNDSKDVCVF